MTAKMTLDMLSATERRSGEMGAPIAIRVGLHTGPATAGVIGATKVFCDVWGNTVNTSSRLESRHGEAGRIQVADAVRQALADRDAFEPRGTVDIKGLDPPGHGG